MGKINADTTRNYYLKDHLGSIRAVLNSTNTVISAQDYDPWGYILENRTYNATSMKYDFTGKERDDETSYDYFGARYYDSKIGRWGQVEPLLDKYVSWSSYAYGICNPICNVDINGLDNYVFDENGDFIETETDDVEQIIVRNSKTGREQYYDFNDVKKDAQDIKDLLRSTNGKLKIYNISSSQIEKWMDEVGARNIALQFPGLGDLMIAYSSLQGMDFDFWEKYLISMMKNTGLNEDNEIRSDKAGYFIFPGSGMAYNGMDAGNFLWGYCMNLAKVPLVKAIAGAQLYQAMQYYFGKDKTYTTVDDSPFDIESIKAGHNNPK